MECYIELSKHSSCQPSLHNVQYASIIATYSFDAMHPHSCFWQFCFSCPILRTFCIACAYAKFRHGCCAENQVIHVLLCPDVAIVVVVVVTLHSPPSNDSHVKQEFNVQLWLCNLHGMYMPLCSEIVYIHVCGHTSTLDLGIDVRHVQSVYARVDGYCGELWLLIMSSRPYADTR